MKTAQATREVAHTRRDVTPPRHRPLTYFRCSIRRVVPPSCPPPRRRATGRISTGPYLRNSEPVQGSVQRNGGRISLHFPASSSSAGRHVARGPPVHVAPAAPEALGRTAATDRSAMRPLGPLPVRPRSRSPAQAAIAQLRRDFDADRRERDVERCSHGAWRCVGALLYLLQRWMGRRR